MPTVANELAKAGYRNHIIGKLFMMSEIPGNSAIVSHSVQKKLVRYGCRSFGQMSKL